MHRLSNVIGVWWAFWAWCGRVDDYKGRFGVIVALLALVAGGCLLVLRALGLVNTLIAGIGVLAIVVGVFFLVAFLAHIRANPTVGYPVEKPEGQAPDVDDLLVEIERDQWDNFNYEAFILELKVRITNRTDRKKSVLSFKLITGGRTTTPTFPTVESRREVDRRRKLHQRLDTQSTIDPGESIAGWLVYALPWASDPGPTEYALSVTDELNQDYAAQ